MTTPDPAVSAFQVYQQLAQLTAKIDVLIAQQADHEARLRLLERGRWPLSNVTALVGMAGVVTAILVAIFKN